MKNPFKADFLASATIWHTSFRPQQPRIGMETKCEYRHLRPFLMPQNRTKIPLKSATQ